MIPHLSRYREVPWIKGNSFDNGLLISILDEVKFKIFGNKKEPKHIRDYTIDFLPIGALPMYTKNETTTVANIIQEQVELLYSRANRCLIPTDSYLYFLTLDYLNIKYKPKAWITEAYFRTFPWIKIIEKVDTATQNRFGKGVICIREYPMMLPIWDRYKGKIGFAIQLEMGIAKFI